MDERSFLSQGELTLPVEAFEALGGIRADPYANNSSSAKPHQNSYGWQNMQAWDLLWSTPRWASKALASTAPPRPRQQTVNLMPGLSCLTKKASLARALTDAYGAAAAAQIMPATFSLSDRAQVQAWSALAAQLGDSSLWILKATAHRGKQAAPFGLPGRYPLIACQLTSMHTRAACVHTCMCMDAPNTHHLACARLRRLIPCNEGCMTASAGAGLKVASYQQAVILVQSSLANATDSSSNRQTSGSWVGRAVLHRQKRTRTHTGSRPRTYAVVQRYLSKPLLINGRKFGIRMWVAVTAHDPLRAYIHSRGLVFFSDDPYNATQYSYSGGAVQVGGGGAATSGSSSSGEVYVAKGHVTNYAMNANGQVWSLDQLRQHLGTARYRQVHSACMRMAALALAAAAPCIRMKCTKMSVSNGQVFQHLGLDFVVDSDDK